MSERDEELETALAQASDQLGLADYYRDCVRPILRAPRDQWPMCCGGGCDPCSGTLVSVADLVLTRLGRKPRFSNE